VDSTTRVLRRARESAVVHDEERVLWKRGEYLYPSDDVEG